MAYQPGSKVSGWSSSDGDVTSADALSAVVFSGVTEAGGASIVPTQGEDATTERTAPSEGLRGLDMI
jgi:hypothetical protein